MKRLFLVPLVAFLWFAPPARAAGTDDVAVVDMVDLIQHHPRAHEINSQFDQDKADAEAFADKETKALLQLKSSLELLPRNSPDRRNKEKEFLSRQNFLKFEIDWRQQEAVRRYMEGLESLYSAVHSLVQRYAREHGIRLVLLKSEIQLDAADVNDFGAKVRLRGVVYSDDTLDITAKIRDMFPTRAPGGGAAPAGSPPPSGSPPGRSAPPSGGPAPTGPKPPR